MRYQSLYFQDPCTPIMESLIDLHTFIMFYVVGIVALILIVYEFSYVWLELFYTLVLSILVTLFFGGARTTFPTTPANNSSSSKTPPESYWFIRRLGGWTFSFLSEIGHLTLVGLGASVILGGGYMYYRGYLGEIYYTINVFNENMHRLTQIRESASNGVQTITDVINNIPPAPEMMITIFFKPTFSKLKTFIIFLSFIFIVFFFDFVDAEEFTQLQLAQQSLIKSKKILLLNQELYQSYVDQKELFLKTIYLNDEYGSNFKELNLNYLNLLIDSTKSTVQLSEKQVEAAEKNYRILKDLQDHSLETRYWFKFFDSFIKTFTK